MAVDDDLTLRLRLLDQKRFSRGLDAAQRDVRGLGRAADRADQHFRGLRTASRGLGSGLRATGAVAVAAGAGLGAAAYGGWRMVEAFDQSRKVSRATQAGIRSTGGAANVTAGQVADLADAISRKTGVDDEAIQAGSNLLLTFTKVRNEAGEGNQVFDRATQAAVDLSARGFGSIDSSSKMLGKALQDPTKGITALSRAGVTFTKGQKQQIEAMVEAGDVLGAQRKIMREVEMQVGGSAEAMASPLDRLRVTFGNLQEAGGSVLWPFAKSAATLADDLVGDLEPQLESLGRKTQAIFDRGDLSRGQKFEMAGQLVVGQGRKIIQPYVADAQAYLRSQDFGEDLGGMVDRAIPVIANRAATGAGRAAEAFARGWWNAGWGGKAALMAAVAFKAGAFGPAARKVAALSATQFGRTFGRRAATTSAASTAAGMAPSFQSRAGSWRSTGSTTGRALGQSAGRTAATSAAAGSAAQIGPSMAGRTGRFRAAGHSAGRVIGRGLVAGAVAGLVMFGPEIQREIEEQLGVDHGRDDAARRGGGVNPSGPVGAIEQGLGVDIPWVGGATGGWGHTTGWVGGHGNGDRQPRMLDRREYILRPEATRALGPDVLRQLNRGRLPMQPVPAPGGGLDTAAIVAAIERMPAPVVHVGLDGEPLAQSTHRANGRARARGAPA